MMFPVACKVEEAYIDALVEVAKISPMLYKFDFNAKALLASVRLEVTESVSHTIPPVELVIRRLDPLQESRAVSISFAEMPPVNVLVPFPFCVIALVSVR